MANFLRFSLISACVTLMCLFDFFDFSQSHATYPPSTGVSPFIVSILRVNESELLCAGTIISNRHVLTGNYRFLIVFLSDKLTKIDFQLPIVYIKRVHLKGFHAMILLSSLELIIVQHMHITRKKKEV